VILERYSTITTPPVQGMVNDTNVCNGFASHAVERARENG